MVDSTTKAIAGFNLLMGLFNAFYFYELRRNDAQHEAMYVRQDKYDDRLRAAEQLVAGMTASLAVVAASNTALTRSVQDIEVRVAGLPDEYPPKPWQDRFHEFAERLAKCEQKLGARP